MDIREIIEKMSLEDKIALCSGADTWHTKKMEQYGIPSIMMADGHFFDGIKKMFEK